MTSTFSSNTNFRNRRSYQIDSRRAAVRSNKETIQRENSYNATSPGSSLFPTPGLCYAQRVSRRHHGSQFLLRQRLIYNRRERFYYYRQYFTADDSRRGKRLSGRRL